jgi:hypothetical protein
MPPLVHRGRTLPLLLCALAVAAVAPATAPADIRYEQRVTGSVTITWAGDPARGCAEAGVCEITGSATVRAHGEGGGEVSGTRDDEAALESLHVDASPGIVRVLRGPPDAPAGACTDRAAAGPAIEVDRVSGGEATILLTPLGAPDEVALAGRCAGPLASDLESAFLTATVERRRLVEGFARIDLSGTRAFAGGPFSGEVRSTLAIERTSRRVRSTTRTSREVPGRLLRRRIAFQMSYDVLRPRGTLVTQWAGGPEPFCLALDACGLSGTHTLRLRPGGARGSLDVFALFPASRVRGRSRRAVSAALRAGRIRPDSIGLSIGGSMRGEATAAWAGGAVCRGETRTTPDVAGDVRGRALVLALGSGEAFGGGEDPLRTRCPGPGSADVPGQAMATGRIPLSRLGARRLGLTLRGGRPASGAFTIARRGEIRLDLRLRRVQLDVFGGRP